MQVPVKIKRERDGEYIQVGVEDTSRIDELLETLGDTVSGIAPLPKGEEPESVTCLRVSDAGYVWDGFELFVELWLG